MAGGEGGASGAPALKGVPRADPFIAARRDHVLAAALSSSVDALNGPSLADLIHGDGQPLQHPVDFGLGGRRSQGQAQRGVSQLGLRPIARSTCEGSCEPA